MPKKNLFQGTTRCSMDERFGRFHSPYLAVGSYLRFFGPLRPLGFYPPLPPMGKSPKPVTGPYEVVPTLSRPGERAEPAPKQRRSRALEASPAFEGQRQDRRAIMERVATYGLKVFCTDCGLMHRHRTVGGERLRSIPSACCGARMRPSRWKGWSEWRQSSRHLRREEPARPADPRVVRVAGQYYMRGFDS